VTLTASSILAEAGPREVNEERRAMNAVNLTGVPETMLWTLHNRASEAKRADSYLHDPECVRVYEAIDYDYSRNFGRPDDSHPMRSKLFDEAVRDRG
jgi:O-methyltransferase involved in polyketide biosynthesis